MANDILAVANALTDRELLARLNALAANERSAVVELVAHLAALDARPSLYAAEGYGSLFSYCTGALRLSEDAACNRIEAARACRRFPAILEDLARGTLSLTSVRLVARHLTADNHASVLTRARGRSRREIEALVAALAPQPDIAASVRKLPAPASVLVAPPLLIQGSAPAEPVLAPATPHPAPIVRASAPARYRMQVTIGEAAHDHLRRLQALLRREVPSGDPAVIVERALATLVKQVEKTKMASTDRPKTPIRPGTDRGTSRSRRIPADVRRAVWIRDGGRCAFVSRSGVRCPELAFLELHHRHPHALGGPPTIANIALRCRRHNEYESEAVFGTATARQRRLDDPRTGVQPVGEAARVPVHVAEQGGCSPR
jgi:5-methylcytosine-specific restriction endonuclease McrA